MLSADLLEYCDVSSCTQDEFFIKYLFLISSNFNLVSQGAELEFARIVKAKRQVVTGTLHDLMLEVVDSGKKSLYSAKVWVKPWLDFKAVVEFRHVGDSQSQSATAADDNAGQGMFHLITFLE